jgi:hypothetical protein
MLRRCISGSALASLGQRTMQPFRRTLCPRGTTQYVDQAKTPEGDNLQIVEPPDKWHYFDFLSCAI